MKNKKNKKKKRKFTFEIGAFRANLYVKNNNLFIA